MDGQSINTQYRDQVSIRVHQQVLVVVREEALDKFEGSLIDALNNKAALFRLDVETATLSLRYTHWDVFKILKWESVLDQGLTDILDASDHIEHLGGKLTKVESASAIRVWAFEHLFSLALFLKLILFDSNIELSEYIRVSKD